MPVERPSYQTLLDRVLAAIDSRLPGADARLPKSDLNVTGHVQAELASSLYDYAGWIADQILENTADEDQLVIIASDFGVYQKPAAAAGGIVTAARTGIGAITVPAGALVQIGGVDYAVAGETVIAADAGDVPVIAVQAGSAGNQAAGLSGNFAQPIAGLAVKVISGAISGGADKESPASLLARLLARKRRPAHGGNPDDFERWALAVPGITRAWPYRAVPRRGFSTVLVVCDGAETGPIPGPAELAEVQAYFDRPDIGPCGCEAVAAAPEPILHDLVIELSPNTAEVQASVASACRAWYRAESVPGQMGALSRLSAAISAATGEVKHRLIAPAADPVLTMFQMPVINSITFQDYD
jgi:uncharacterized phage protein gp47/JayE